MGHFAKVVGGIVTEVIVAEPDYMATFIDTTPGDWYQASFNTFGGVHYEPNTIPKVASADQSKALRKNFPAIGFSYNKELDAFIPPKPYPSWVLNNQTGTWNAPVAMPTDAPEGKMYHWKESNQSWVLDTVGADGKQ